tara:strand:+ start:49412 stop:49882 length:471 start_codon:yes stop_codon:yes gene_type:complete
MPVRENIAARRLKDNEADVARIGAVYLRKKKDEKDVKSEIEKMKKELKGFFTKYPDLVKKNGKHLEIFADLGDNANEVFIQLQHRESVSTVDNIIDLVKAKLGKKADQYIRTVEVLHDNALESMLSNELIDEDDLLDWTKTKETKSLIVKANKAKK